VARKVPAKKASSSRSKSRETPVINIVQEDDELAFPEGKRVYQLHRTKERNSKIVTRVKVKKLKIDPLLRCEVCGFSFVEKFGELGMGFIEAHHMIPVSELSENTLTKEKDIVLVCSNCHRMLHRHRPWLSAVELKSVLLSKNKRIKAAR
jgi:predicted HNH restriction endonuclease